MTSCGGETSNEELSEENTTRKVNKGDLVINEYCYKGRIKNELGDESDWLELHNTTNKNIILNAREWTLSDDPEESNNFFLPEVTIESNGYLLIFCDNNDCNDEEIHTGFKLNSEKESISLFHLGKLMDQQSHDSTGTEFDCKCRVTDNGEWEYSNDPTPGVSNN